MILGGTPIYAQMAWKILHPLAAFFGSDGHRGFNRGPSNRTLHCWKDTLWDWLVDFVIAIALPNLWPKKYVFDLLLWSRRTFHVHSQGFLPECCNQALDLGYRHGCPSPQTVEIIEYARLMRASRAWKKSTWACVKILESPKWMIWYIYIYNIYYIYYELYMN